MAIYFPLGDSSLINHQRTFVFLVEVGEEEDEMKHEASKEHEQTNPNTKKCWFGRGAASLCWEAQVWCGRRGEREEDMRTLFCFFLSDLNGREKKFSFFF